MQHIRLGTRSLRVRWLVAGGTFETTSHFADTLHVFWQACHIGGNVPHDPVALHLISGSQVIHDQGVALRPCRGT